MGLVRFIVRHNFVEHKRLNFADPKRLNTSVDVCLIVNKQLINMYKEINIEFLLIVNSWCLL